MAEGEKMIAGNRRARHEYHILEELEAGLALTGTEVKSLREGKASIAEGYVEFRDDGAWLVGAHIPPYSHGNIANHEPFRKRRLLLRAREIKKWGERVRERGYTVVPLALYFSKGLAKLKIGLAKGKSLGDKRETMREKDASREIERELRRRG
ncbi:SsrA-binding protein SmpB [bacterium]|nr:SsrA-binding protein SmpB [bacterium]